MYTSKKNSGFTLIELLVVIAIISVLSSVVLTSLAQARAKARDSKRTSEVREMITALELYYGAHGKFPCHEVMFDNSTDNSHVPNFMRPLIAEGYLGQAPHDPLSVKVDPLKDGNSYLSYYEYATYSIIPRDLTDPGDPNFNHCGDLAFLGIYMETPGAPCPSFGRSSNDSNALGHCHIWYPDIPPAPCGQYAFQGFGGRLECKDFMDLDCQNDPAYNDAENVCQYPDF